MAQATFVRQTPLYYSLDMLPRDCFSQGVSNRHTNCIWILNELRYKPGAKLSACTLSPWFCPASSENSEGTSGFSGQPCKRLFLQARDLWQRSRNFSCSKFQVTEKCNRPFCGFEIVMNKDGVPAVFKSFPSLLDITVWWKLELKLASLIKYYPLAILNHSP